MTITRMLQTVGKRTFINCFEERKNKGRELSEVDVMNADSPDSEGWDSGSISTKTSCFNRIFRENKEREALQICCKSRASNVVKAIKLYEEYY